MVETIKEAENMALPVPKLHKASGRAFVYYKGKTTYLGKFGSKEASDKYWEWRATLGRGASGSCSVDELFERYLGRTEAIPRKFIIQTKLLQSTVGTLGKLSTEDFGPLALREFRKALIAPGTRCAGHVNELVQQFQRVFQWGISMELVKVESYSALKTVPRLKPEDVARKGKGRVAVPREIVERTLPHLHDHACAIMSLQLLTGARPGEIVGMRKSWIDRQGPKGVWVYRPIEHKTAYKGKKRHLVFGKQAQLIITDHLTKYPNDTDWVFPSEESQSGHYTPAALCKAVRVACKQAAIPKWTPYQVRHLKLTEIATEHGLDAAIAVAGHGDVDTTATYLHQPDAETLRRAI